MIREFWQERAEEKRKQKEFKKQNRKQPKTKEQIAYKIFGVCFVLFLIFGSIFYTCSSFNGVDDNYSWDNLIGITDGVKSKLTKFVNKDELISGQAIDVDDWDNCKDRLSVAGLDVVIDNRLNVDLLMGGEQHLTSTLILDSSSLGALLVEMLREDLEDQNLSLIELVIYYSGEDIRLRSLLYVNLSSIIISDNLPYVYITTDSQIEILDRRIKLMGSSFVINDLEDEDNVEVLNVVEKNSLIGLDYFTTQRIADNINNFASFINAEVNIDGTNITFIPKNI